MTKEYEDKFIKAILTGMSHSTDNKLRIVINKIYEDGFQDGNELADKGEDQKDEEKLPDWNQKLEDITNGITDCNNKELIYLKEQIEKEIRLSRIAIKEGFEEVEK